jgi:hypothetical protein
MNSYRLFIIILGIALVSSCRKKDKDECPVCPIVDNISPVSGHAGDIITINGSQFKASGNIVKINDVLAEVLSESSSQVRAKVPRNCGSGPVTVDLDEELTSNRTVSFTYIKKYTVTTFAGTPPFNGDLDGAAAVAKFSFPKGIVADKLGNVYVADRSNNCIRKIKAGQVTTFAGKKSTTGGYADSPVPTLAQFNFPYGIDINNSGELFVADLFNDCIRKVLPSGAVSTLTGKGTVPGDVDGPSTLAQFNWPTDVLVYQDSILFVVDYLNNKIKRVSTNGKTKTLAGTGIKGNVVGPLLGSQFFAPLSIGLFDDASMLVVDNGNVAIKGLSLKSAVTANFAGTGLVGAFNDRSASSTFNYPTDVVVRIFGGQREVYIADQSNNVIRLIDANGNVSTIVGDGTPGFKDGEGIEAQLNKPYGLAFDVLDNSISLLAKRKKLTVMNALSLKH